MIAHEVNNTTAGITSTLDTVEQALSTEEGMDDISSGNTRPFADAMSDIRSRRR